MSIVAWQGECDIRVEVLRGRSFLSDIAHSEVPLLLNKMLLSSRCTARSATDVHRDNMVDLPVRSKYLGRTVLLGRT